MQRINKPIWRAAAAIHNQLARCQIQRSAVNLPSESWRTLEQIARQVEQAERRGFDRATKRLLADLVCHAERLHLELSMRAAQWRKEAQRPGPPNVADVYRDLLALNEEFEEVNCDLKASTLSVRTAPIDFLDIQLGTFRIELDWADCKSSFAYRVVALEPNPASSDESVTHPHVMNEQLCEGDGHSAIQAALEQGRVCDFFLLVAAVLDTYAAGNAFVEMDDWRGETCADCGGHISSEDACRCAACQTTLCADCRLFCSQCDDEICSSCVWACASCQANCCRYCRSNCAACQRPCCSKCLVDSLCNSCRARGDGPYDDSQQTNQEGAAAG